MLSHSCRDVLGCSYIAVSGSLCFVLYVRISQKISVEYYVSTNCLTVEAGVDAPLARWTFY